MDVILVYCGKGIIEYKQHFVQTGMTRVILADLVSGLFLLIKIYFELL